MGVTVYADLLFLINFSMDFLVFFITSKLCSQKLMPGRIALAAAIGGAYGVLALFIAGGGVFAFVCELCALFLICFIAFWRRGMSLWHFISSVFIFFTVSLLLGGVMTAAYSFVNRLELFGGEHCEGDDISVWLFALLSAAGSAAALVGGRSLRRIKSAVRVNTVIGMGDRRVRLLALEDTGNMLHDPIGGRVVVICELEAVAELFDEELVEYFRSNNISAATSLDERYSSQLRFVPAKGAISEKLTILSAIAPTVFYIESGGEKIECEVLIAPVGFPISAGECRALIPSGLIH